ncbi:MAG: leucine-rich repeat domain-containing protein [Veillonella sp.]|jgi:hypothetical protein|nr:leucine-rich repeat domain-containing protein [Veillonella sp.]
MAVLIEKQIKNGFNCFYGNEVCPRAVVELSEYDGEDSLTINCTQLEEEYSAKEKKRIKLEWCDFFVNNPNTFTELVFCTRMPQDLFDAVCSQRKLKKLHIKWGVYPDISKLENLQELEYLSIGSGRGVLSIEPISKLENLVALSIENFQKIHDYSSLANLKKLESLSLEGDFASPKNLDVQSLNFLRDMQQLRFFSLLTARVQDGDYSPILELNNLEHLTLKSCKEVQQLYPQLIKLPKLKYGSLIGCPELYT